MGCLFVRTTLDTGATCNAMPEELVLRLDADHHRLEEHFGAAEAYNPVVKVLKHTVPGVVELTRGGPTEMSHYVTLSVMVVGVRSRMFAFSRCDLPRIRQGCVLPLGLRARSPCAGPRTYTVGLTAPSRR